ncbi:MAG TPA: BREX system Lon protease-like protein BrxL [Candidatus Saccharimonadales bacterium]|nr:BREX system Lon protease-like protein BrxL [Candidatus Saccharimonadales bacterium]
MADDIKSGTPQPLSALDGKIFRTLGDRVILKPLTRWNEAYKEFPRYVMEYLVSRYVDAAKPVDGQKKIDRILSEHYAESAKKELIKSRIKERGQYTLLGQLSVRLDQSRDHYWATVPALGDDTVRVAQKVLTQYSDVLLTSGAWGTMEIEYDGTYEIKSRKFPFYIREFTPLQYTRLNLDDFVEKCVEFTDEEWLDLLIQSIGFNPAKFDLRVKMLMLLRLVPFVESNYNLIELGPRETGKTYTFRNTSNRAFVVSGGTSTVPSLFYNKTSKKLGVIGLKHLVFFDEIAHTNFNDEASISMLKDYMQTGKFSRGDQEFSAPCSIVLGGNIDTDLDRKQPDEGYRHLFQVLPQELQDPAFLDRIHGYLPGWEMPKIRPENYATGYGLLTDYMAEIFAELRRRNFQTHVNAWVDFGAMTGRNQDAIKKTAAGLLKLLHPHRSPDTLTGPEVKPLMDMAVEMRQRVTDQLAKILPTEFSNVQYGFKLRGENGDF